MPFQTIAFVAADSEPAQKALTKLRRRYGDASPEAADVIVTLGGDGTMLETLHRYRHRGVPFYGMNRGTVGFLLNEFRETGLRRRLDEAQPVTLHPLRMRARTLDGPEIEGLAINEVSMLRESRQAAKLRIRIDGKVRMKELVCDGVLIATPAGSTAYNLSAHGPIVPMGSNLLALTPISAFRPRRWRGALLPSTAEVRIQAMEPTKRPVSAVADDLEVRDVREVWVNEAKDISLTLLFDPKHNLEERILNEQFAP